MAARRKFYYFGRVTNLFSSPKRELNKILDNDYSVNSGVYSAVIPSIKMEMDEYGEYKPVFTAKLSRKDYQQLLKVDMMSDRSPDESEIAKDLFSSVSDIKYDKTVGYYADLYAGHVKVGDFRARGSSGGMTSWILAELRKRGEIDGVLHIHAVDPKDNDGKLFKYVISESVDAIKQGAKSRYYPGELSDVLREVKSDSSKKYAAVGIPEFITELRLLSRIDKSINTQIPFMLGLVCGHQKTAKYAESLAWQHGIKPGNLTAVDFRIKQPNSTAMDYLHEFTGVINGEVTTVRKKHEELFGEVWAHGFFKSNFSDFSDNVYNELGDVVLGDAWLPEYNKDGMGNNIVIVRNPLIKKIIQEGIVDKSLQLDKVDVATIKQSQRGLIHHNRDEIRSRIDAQRRRLKWVPRKRFESARLPLVRHRIQQIRYKMARKSHVAYQEALRKEDWKYFKSVMQPLIQAYDHLYNMKGGRLAQNRRKSFARDMEFIVDYIRHTIRIRTRLRQLKRKLRLRTRVKEYIRGRKSNKEAMLRKGILENPEGAIVTLTDYHNYGNMLQRYALQRFLLHHNYRLISYAQEEFDVRGAKFDKFRNTIKFVEERIPRKKPDIKDRYGIYITGSDQVWRKWGGTDDSLLEKVRYYFFDFVQNDEAKRVAYAASFGHDNIEDSGLTADFMKSVKPLVDKMSGVSIRERSGVDIAKQWWNVDAMLAVDPTMLLTKKDYDLLIDISTCQLVQSKPLFAYVVRDEDNRRESDIRHLEQVYGLSGDATSLKDAPVLPPVEQWLQNIRDAELVVTDSFHGVVFSIINNTPFIVLVNKFGGYSRIETLLNEFNLQDRLLKDEDIETHTANSMKPINWIEVNRLVRKYRQSSKRWLLESIGE